MKKSSNILIVDDEVSGRETLRALLMGRGYDLFFAEDGPEALEKAKEIKPDLILLDVMMPGMDGFEVCSHLRRDPILSDVPVIMITALDDRDSRIQGIEAGADDFISKPYDTTELRTRVKTITALNRYRRLLEERARFEWVVEQAEDGYVMMDDRDEIIYANPGAKLYLGIEDKDFPLKETFIELAKKQYRFEPGEAWRSWPEVPDSPMYLLRPENENSDAFWLQVELIEMSSEKSSGYLIRLRNVTEKVVLRSNTWTFHSLVAHKLRTPLAALGFILEFLNMDNFSDSQDTLKEVISEGYSAALRIKEQIQNVMDSIESKDVLKPSLGRCSIKEIIDFIEEPGDTPEVKKPLIDCKIDNQEKVYISFSLAAMQMVMRELFINSRKFHPENSPFIKVIISSLPEGICFEVLDDGLSLSPEQLSKMWIPYYQAERYFTGEVPGMGLGLSTIASIIWTAGGTCKSHNNPDGPGVGIEITLPEKKEEK